ncbi:MAG: hypothetical protein LBR53_00620 [Deltaproteobacteria bacterium]|jgi:hypothetical protein|nr:hypothetical protein [Deltaproteobacteria bacterium]
MDPNRQFSLQETVDSVSKPYGHVYLLNSLAEAVGLTGVLKKIFPEKHRRLLAVAQFYALNTLPLSRARRWAEETEVPAGAEDLSVDAVMDCFRSLDYEDLERFAEEWGRLFTEDSYFVYDTTLFAERNTSQLRALAGEKRALSGTNVLDLLLLIGRKTFLPMNFFLYNGRPGKVEDLLRAAEDSHGYDRERVIYILGERYYSDENLNILLDGKKESVFMLRVKRNARGVFEQLRENFDNLKDRELSVKKDKYVVTDRVRLGEKRLYAHVFKNRLDKVAAANATQYNLKNMLRRASRDPGLFSEDENYRSHLSFYPSSASASGYNVETKLGAINRATAELGWTVLLSNYVRQGERALFFSEKWGIVQKCFDNLNDFSDVYSFPISILQSSAADVTKFLQGRIFCVFLSLILLSHVDNVMYSQALYANHTMDELFAELASIRMVNIGGEKAATPHTPRQRHIYKAFNCPVPPGSKRRE